LNRDIRFIQRLRRVSRCRRVHSTSARFAVAQAAPCRCRR
jgi:hypothetical protein